MAALVRHVLRKTGQEISFKFTIPLGDIVKRDYRDRLPKTVESGPTVDALAKSLAHKGYLRKQHPYLPPEDVSEKIDRILADSNITDRTKKLEMAEKFNILKTFAATFDHTLPYSRLSQTDTVDDIIEFYNTEVNTTVPLEALKQMDLPSNLHIGT